MSDTVFIESLSVETIIGAFPWERQVMQTLRLDLALDTDVRSAAASDALTDALDYKAVADHTIQFCRDQRCQLVEALAEALAQSLFERFAVKAVTLTVRKPGAVRDAAAVGVRIHRSRGE